MSETYVVTKTKKPRSWEIAKFSDYKDADSLYQVSKRGNKYWCNCPGFARQKNKEEHKHCLIVKHWVENLQETEGTALWVENDEIKSYKFIPSISYFE